MASRRIYVTGIGAVSAAGGNVLDIVRTMSSGKSPLARVSRFNTSVNVPAGEVPDNDDALRKELGLPGEITVSRTSLLGIKAVREALNDHFKRTGGALPGKAAFISGTSVGGMDLSEVFWASCRNSLEEGDPSSLSVHDPGASTDGIREYAPDSPLAGEFWRRVTASSTVSTACSSAGNAIMLAARMIEAGIVDMAIAGGTDSLCRFTLNGFNSLRILDPENCRPFDISRAGLNLGEGAGYIVLASGEYGGAHCVLSGWANADDAYHQTASTPEGTGPSLAMHSALESAGLSPEDISFINTHGTGTPVNDLAESNAMLEVFRGNVPPFSSLKPFIGHALGASEGIEAALVCYALSEGQCGFMRSLNFNTPIPETGLVPYDGEEIMPRSIMSSAFGFGGNCVTLIFSRQ
ncbi:MAG: beta-ketoacyl-[acyl-carrier-protein] synthase family protein [Candidatus Cryptobacteroides sp.]